MDSILTLADDEARRFLLLPENYCLFDMPSYINFKAVLAAAEKSIRKYNPCRNGSTKIRDLYGVNHTVLSNKDGAYAWRPFQLIHPVLYVEVINDWGTIQGRFRELQANDKIKCTSIPVLPEGGQNKKEDRILNWWDKVEQESIRLSLEYRHLALTDITDCYGTLYTHTVAWALHGKKIAKKQKMDKDLLGNRLDGILQDMQEGQTNGIPQGSVISDLIAELVIGYADIRLSEKIENTGITDYKILRYKDDYRIFTQTAEEAQRILLMLNQVLSELNFKFNTAKTHVSEDVVTCSVKPDKLYWINAVRYGKNLFETLFIISRLATNYPNSGSLVRALGSFRRRLETIKKRPKNNNVLIPIVVDIMYKNPRIYPTASSILSKLLSFESEKETKNYINLIRKKFDNVPNIGFLDIWLQRISINYDRSIDYKEKLCKVVAHGDEKLWNSDWLVPQAKEIIESTSIVDESKMEKLSKVIPLAETEIFLHRY